MELGQALTEDGERLILRPLSSWYKLQHADAFCYCFDEGSLTHAGRTESYGTPKRQRKHIHIMRADSARGHLLRNENGF